MLYRLRELDNYKNLTDEFDFRSSSWVAIKCYMRNIHPFFSLITRFDYRMKRFMRMCLLLGQICVITILVWLMYSINMKDWELLA